jgi:bifunctional oligoribonuclease and PAP phosphatase NrnA
LNEDYRFAAMTAQYQDAYEKAAHLIESSQKVILIPHYNPDGDAIGSCLALYNLLLKKGKEVYAISPNEYPEFLSWMKNSDQILFYNQQKERLDELISQADLLIMVDFSSGARMQAMESSVMKSKAKKINIDHHPEPEQLADLLFSDTSVSSTSEYIYRFIRETGNLHFMDNHIASCIYCGIMTDTGCFSHNSSQPETWEIVASLLRYNINKDNIFSKVFQEYSEQRMKLLGYCLNEKMVVLPEFHTAFISLTMEELDRYNHQLGDTEGFVNIPFTIQGIIFSAFFMEKSDHTKISLRSKGDFDVNAFARRIYTGGGHRNAAGATSQTGLGECIQAFKDEMHKQEAELIRCASNFIV